MTEDKKGIKETTEIINGLTEAFKVGKAIRDIVKDGIDSSDLIKAFDLVREQADKIETYSIAIQDAKLAKEELKDLDKEEILAILFKLVDAVEQIENA